MAETLVKEAEPEDAVMQPAVMSEVPPPVESSSEDDEEDAEAAKL